MSHILVKWMAEEAWDVYPITCVLDSKIAATIAKKPASVGGYTGKVFDILWDPSKEPSPAYLVAAGDLNKMEKLRTELAQQSSSGEREHTTAPDKSSNTSQSEKCCTHRAEVKRLRNEMRDLEARLHEAESKHEAAKMVKRLEKIISKVQNNNVTSTSHDETKVDIANGVLVDKVVLDRLHNTFQGNRCKFARNLTRILFTAEDLRGRSLYGTPSNVKKDAPTKPGLDKTRLNAILDYTSSKFGTPLPPIKRSLASMLLNLKDA
ncbi:uncharacterized protein LOC135378884 [Ornithodoros turicata]|uniref:uncharacterized protein LOC135378884 n=1 Tax=Ornithodoros turicata TaxID=34597 RepID=UPI003139DD5D